MICWFKFIKFAQLHGQHPRDPEMNANIGADHITSSRVNDPDIASDCDYDSGLSSSDLINTSSLDGSLSPTNEVFFCL